MSFWQRLFGSQKLPTVDSTGVVVARDAVWVYLRCKYCGEPIAVRLSKTTDLQREDSPDYAWFVNKTIVGSKNRCYKRMELHLEFDQRFRILKKELKGGSFISQHEYESSKSTHNK